MNKKLVILCMLTQIIPPFMVKLTESITGGKIKMMRKLLIVLAVSVLFTTGCSTNQATPSTPSTTQSIQPSNTAKGNIGTGSSKPIPTPPSGSATPLVITKEQYDNLKLNLTFGEVQKELGLGKLIKQTDHQAIYQYNGKNGGNAELIFWDGVLNSKSANDLK